jgi:hypothetical protein
MTPRFKNGEEVELLMNATTIYNRIPIDDEVDIHSEPLPDWVYEHLINDVMQEIAKEKGNS